MLDIFPAIHISTLNQIFCGIYKYTMRFYFLFSFQTHSVNILKKTTHCVVFLMPLPHKFVCMKRVDGIDNNKSAKEVYERRVQAVRRAPFFGELGSKCAWKELYCWGLTVNEWVTLVVEIYMNEIINIPSHHDGRKYIWASARWGAVSWLCCCCLLSIVNKTSQGDFEMGQ